MAPAKKIILKSLNFLLFLAVGVLCLYLAFKDIPLGNFWNDLAKANYLWVVLSLIGGIASHMARAYRWNLLIEPLEYKPRFLYTLYSVFIGYFANMAFPRLGEVTRCAALSKSDKIPVESLLGTVIIERAVDVLILILLLFTVFFARIDIFGSFIQQHIFEPLTGRIGQKIHSSWLPWLFILVALLLTTGMIYIFRERLGRLPRIGKMKQLLKGMMQGIRSLFIMKKVYRFILSSLLIWFLYLLTTYLFFLSIPATSGLGMLEALFILVFGSIGMTLPVQGGFGTYHLFVSLGLTLFSISREDGLVYAILSHESQTLMLIILGSISFSMIYFSKRKSSTISTTNM